MFSRVIFVCQNYGCKSIGRNYSTFVHAQESIQTSSKSKHVYKQILPWKTLKEFRNALVDQIVYCDGGVVAVNKPYGVPIYKTDYSDKTKPALLRTSIASNCSYSLQEALPFLANHVSEDNLEIVKTCERYCSGIIVLAANPETAKRLKKAVRRAKAERSGPTVYWALTLGSPQAQEGSESVGIQIAKAEDGVRKQPVICADFSGNAKKRGEVYPIFVQYRTELQSRQTDAAIVSIKTTRNKWNFLRVFMAHQLSPILGDNVYGGRVQSVFNTNVAVDPFHDAAQSPQVLPRDIMTRLDLFDQGNSSALLVPTHLHLRQIILPSFPSKTETLVLTAPPPQHFLWTCAKLGLDVQALSK